jgi:hypothetical protein
MGNTLAHEVGRAVADAEPVIACWFAFMEYEVRRERSGVAAIHEGS